MQWFLAAHAVPTMETFAGSRYCRTLTLPRGPGVVEVDFGDAQCGGVHVSVQADTRDHDAALAAITALLALNVDSAAADAALSDDPLLAAAISAAPGVRVPGAVDGAEVVLRTMIGQQISMAAAATHTARLVQALGAVVDTDRGPMRLFPTPSAVASEGLGVLTGPTRRVDAIVAVAAAIAAGRVDLSPGRTATDLERDLLALRGIGPWTARYTSMRVLGDPDVLLDTDLVVRQGAAVLGLNLAEHRRWAPFRSYVSMHLWRVALDERARVRTDARARRRRLGTVPP